MPADLAAYDVAAAALIRECDAAKSEMTVAARCEAALVPLLAEYGVPYTPHREKQVITSDRRRIDSQFGAVVTEYKQHIKGQKGWDVAMAQLIGYVETIAPEPAARDEHVGVVTDGRRIGFVTFDGGIARAELDAPLDGPRLRRYVETLVALGRRGLTASHLVDDFAVDEASGPGLGRELARACYDALENATAKTGMLQSEWQRIFARTIEDRPVAPPGHATAYAAALDLTAPADPARALFALQTAYAIVVKLVAARVLVELHVGASVLRFDALAALPAEALRQRLARLEDGEVLRDYGLDNLLEGDFFSWYAAEGQWTPALARAVAAVVARLAEYEGRAPLLRPGALGDMFRQLYQRSIPAVVRHDLGEYYTPRWLAQAVLADTPAGAGWRGLDPCCGSGTFVVEMIGEVLAQGAHLAPPRQLQQVLARVTGIDLNPLAVLTARVNYFLAIASLLADQPPAPIEIPIYLGDAAHGPRAYDMAGVAVLGHTLPTALGPIDVTLPLALARQGTRFGAAMRDMELAIVALDGDRARKVLHLACGAEAANPAVADALDHLVDTLMALERQGWNRIWGRIIKNFLATATLGEFDRVVGNPPWVEWKDLPPGYRETIHALCKSRGLFSDDGYVGGTDLNLCALIAHVVLERWVRPGGYMGFLMPKQLLQVRSSQGLRRLKLPDGTVLGLRALADWTALRPFDAACQPVTYLIQRGFAGPETVPLRRYAARHHVPRPAHAPWAAVAPDLLVEDLAALRVDDDGGPYMIDAPEALAAMKTLWGACPYRGRRATETSPHGVFWVRPVAGARPLPDDRLLVENALNPRSRDGVVRETVALERERLFPLLRGKGIAAFAATPDEALVVFAHEPAGGAAALPPERMPPLTLAYLQTHRAALERRGSYREYRQGQPFYGLWRVGPYTFAPFKVVWPEMGELRAAVIATAPVPWDAPPRMLVPEGKVNFVPCETAIEAHYLCAILNAPLVRRAYRACSSQLGRPSRLPFALPLFTEVAWTHRALAAVSLAAHGKAVPAARRDAILGWLLGRALSSGLGQEHREVVGGAPLQGAHAEGRHVPREADRDAVLPR